VRKRGCIGQVIDAYNIDIESALLDRAQNESSDTTESIDRNTNGHGVGMCV
jgi:hypothetical protein